MEKAELIDQSTQIKNAEIEIEAKNVAEVLSSEMKIGDSVSMIDALRILQKGARLFDCSVKWGRKKLIEITESGFCNHKDKSFRYFFNPEDRSKHWLVCRKFSDFLA
jgi:hypothetical protein